MLTLPTNIDKAEIEAFVNHVTAEVMDGHVDPLSVHIRCKAVVKALEAIIELTEEVAKDSAATYGKGEFMEAIGLLRSFLKENPKAVHAKIRIAEIYEKDLRNPVEAAYLPILAPP